MQNRLITTPARKLSKAPEKTVDAKSYQNRLEKMDDSLMTEIHDRMCSYEGKAKVYFSAGNMDKALRSLNEAARTYSRFEPISENVAYFYRCIADIYYNPGSHLNHEQAFYFYKKALKIYSLLFDNVEHFSKNEINDLYQYAFKCYSRMSAIYYNMGAAYDCSIGTYYDYEFCFWIKNMTMEPGKLYFTLEKNQLIYWVLIGRKPAKGTIDLISTPSHLTLTYLNRYKNDILRLTSKANHTRVYDSIDSDYSKKMKERALSFNKKILSTFVNLYGIYDLKVADCCNDIGVLYQSIKQNEIANYFFDLASGIRDLLQIIKSVHPNALEVIRLHFSKSKGPDWDASMILTFIRKYALDDVRTEKCCFNLGALYHFIEQKGIAQHFLNFASEMMPVDNALNNQKLWRIETKENKLTEAQSKTITGKKPDKARSTSRVNSFVKKCIKTAVEGFKGEEKTSTTSFFKGNTLFSSNQPNTEGQLYNHSFVNTYQATFSKNSVSAQMISPNRTNILGFLINPRLKNRLPAKNAVKSNPVHVKLGSRNL